MFQCESCGCAENTHMGLRVCQTLPKIFDWDSSVAKEPMKVCYACAPLLFDTGEKTRYNGEWHDRFPRVFLPKGMFFTNSVGNLEHKETGSIHYQEYAIDCEQ